jgi:hypothetical protein
MLKPSHIIWKPEYFIGDSAQLGHMVSRSLEKLLLIAIGLSMVVMVGVPVLIYTMDTLSSASQLESAHAFADRLHNYTARVDQGLEESISVQVTVPSYIEMSSAGNTLVVSFVKDDNQVATWSESYLHSVNVSEPASPGVYTLVIALNGDTVEIEFLAAMA